MTSSNHAQHAMPCMRICTSRNCLYSGQWGKRGPFCEYGFTERLIQLQVQNQVTRASAYVGILLTD